MRSKNPRARRIGLFLSLLLVSAAPVVAQTAAQPAKPAAASAKAPVPWLYKGSDVPQDKAWIFGTLPNGIRYAVRHNGVPPEQVSIRVLVDAGSMYETEPQRGYAWIKAGNAAFAGKSALEVMLGGELTDLMRVRRYLDAERGLW